MIINVFKKCLEDANTLDYFEKEIMRLCVEKNEEIVKRINDDYATPNLLGFLVELQEAKKNKLSVKEMFKVISLYSGLHARINEDKFYKNENGEWIFCAARSAQDLDRKIKNRIDIFSRETNRREKVEIFLDLFEWLIEIRNGEIFNHGIFSPLNYIKSGLIQEEKSLSRIYSFKLIDRMKVDGFKIDHALLANLIDKEGKNLKNGISIFDQLIELYGDVNKDENYLIHKLIVEKNEMAIERLIPKLNSFSININNGSVSGIENVSLYNMAKMYDLSEGLCDYIKNESDRYRLVETIQSMSPGRDRMSSL